MWYDKALDAFSGRGGNPQVETIFHSAVPYRVTQFFSNPDFIILLRDCDNNFDINAPKVLAAKDGLTTFTSISDIKTLSFGDKIYVKKYRSKNRPISSFVDIRILKHDRFIIDFDGIAILAEHDSSLIRCYDFSYISRIDGTGRYWITDRKCFDHREVHIRKVVGIPKESQKLGTRLRCEYIKFPKNSFHYPGSSLRILPSVLKNCHLCVGALHSERKFFEDDLLISVSIAEKLENCKDLSNDLICLYTCLFCMFTKDKTEKIERTMLNWKFTETSEYSQVTYKSYKEILGGEQFQNCVNALFTRYSTAILKRHDPDESEDGKSGKEFPEIHVKINKAIFKEHEVIIGFKVKVENVLKEWNLKSSRELVTAKYTLEPTDIFAHWRPFIEKLVEEDDCFGKILKASSTRAKILEAFMPILPVQEIMQICSTSSNMQINQRQKAKGKGKKNAKKQPKPKPTKTPMAPKIMQINQLPNVTEEIIQDKFLQPGQLPYAHIIAQKEIITGKPIVIIDGGPQTGKTTLNSAFIPDILDSNIQIECDEISKCLVLVGPTTKCLKTQLKMVQENVKYQSIQSFVRILDLIDFDDQKPGSFMAILKKTAKEYHPSEEDKVKLIAGMDLLKTKFCAFHHENETGYERDIIMPKLSKEEKQALEDSTDTHIDLITSKELLIFQDAIKVIFNYYRPNFVIASNETFISLLPAMSNYISHIVVDEAGRVPFIEVLNMITETAHLEQLILNGDSTTYPYYHRVRLDPLPECFDSVLKRINLYSSEISYIQLNKSFGMHPGIVGVIKDVFYPARNLVPLFSPPESMTSLFRCPNIPIAFHNVGEVDEYVPPTTRKNFYQSYIALKILQQQLLCNLFDGEKILILCNYSAEKQMFQESLKENGLADYRRIKVKCVDNAYGDHADIVIYITTRAIDDEKHAYLELNKGSIVESCYELGELRENFHYVFEKQRIQTAISRAKKAVFIVGSRDLLEYCPAWKKLIQLTSINNISHKNVKEELQREKDRKQQLEQGYCNPGRKIKNYFSY